MVLPVNSTGRSPDDGSTYNVRVALFDEGVGVNVDALVGRHQLVCMCARVCTCVCADVCTCKGRQTSTSGIFLNHAPPFLSETGSRIDSAHLFQGAPILSTPELWDY